MKFWIVLGALSILGAAKPAVLIGDIMKREPLSEIQKRQGCECTLGDPSYIECCVGYPEDCTLVGCCDLPPGETCPI